MKAEQWYLCYTDFSRGISSRELRSPLRTPLLNANIFTRQAEGDDKHPFLCLLLILLGKTLVGSKLIHPSYWLAALAARTCELKTRRNIENKIQISASRIFVYYVKSSTESRLALGVTSGWEYSL